LHVQIEVEAAPGAIITARLFRCNATVLSPAHAITLHQMTPTSVSVCARIVDGDSGIQTMLVGVGSTPGGLQVAPWTHVTNTGHVTLPVHVQQSSPLFATVVAQNHAGQWARFVSQPVTFDLTPPRLSNLEVTLTYNDTANVTIVQVDAAWSAEDLESGLNSCSCLLCKCYKY
jgi:hypothetical protein